MASKTSLEFTKILRRSLFLDAKENALFDQIPDTVLEGIFQHNFNGNLKLAERILLNRYSEVDRVDRTRLEQEKQNIANLQKCSKQIAEAIKNNRPVLFITDNDNDGSLAQAILIEFVKALPEELRSLIHIEYAQPIGASRGLTREVVDKAMENRRWGDDQDVLIVTADNGINNQVEVERIRAVYRNANLIITDHHLPMEDKVVQENSKVTIFNPKFKPTAYFQKKNISGANTLGVLLKDSFSKILQNLEQDAPEQHQVLALANMDEIGSWANLLDYANADIADMPVRPYIIEQALKLRPLLNVSNSMSNLVTGNFSADLIAEVALASVGTGQNQEGLTAEWIKEKLDTIKTLNVVSRKLLNLYHTYGHQQNSYTEKDFYNFLAEEMQNPNDAYGSANPNYIEQLRPMIFNLAAIDNKDSFLARIADSMMEVFRELRSQEQSILRSLREVGLLRDETKANSSIMYPIDDNVTRIFNRKLLGKAYNRENNGFSLILSDFNHAEAKGSMRSLYSISELLEDKSEIEDQLGISVEFQGHEQAAGFFIVSKDGSPLTEQKIADFNTWMDDRVGEMKLAEKLNQMPTMEVDFASVGLVTKINAAIKANLAGMWGIPTILRFSPDRENGVWITDNETTEQVNLSDLVQRKQYGYQAIKTDFHGSAIVVPIELLRAIVESNYTKALRLSYMDEGVFMGSQVVIPDQMAQVLPLKGGRQDQEALVEYYEKTFKYSNFIDLDRKAFESSPYFRFNQYGESEFNLWEGLIIEMLDQSDSDILAVIDTEGTGLGKAPKCFNIGGTNIQIDPKSGSRMSEAQFDKHYFRSDDGKEFLLTAKQLADVSRHAGDETQAGVVLYKASLENNSTETHERLIYSGRSKDLMLLTNMKQEGDEVVFNRSIKGSAFSFIIKNQDFAITKEFEDLTGIGNWMVDRLGRTASHVDNELVKYYEGLTNAQGEPARIIFQAHNMPYDRGVMAANFQHFNRLLKENLTSDTAKIARAEKLAYDDTPVSSFEGINGLPARAYFYDSPYSDYSLSTFLARTLKGKGGVFADIRAKLLLRYNPETERFSIIDREFNREVLIDATPETLMERKIQGQLPNNAIKYSVESLSSRAMIRNILLFNRPRAEKLALNEDEMPYQAALELFQENYHFDSTIQKNVENFRDSLVVRNDPAVFEDLDIVEFAERFLALNSALQARFHDGWIYEKVLRVFEPNPKNKRIPADIIEQINYLTDLPSKKVKQVLKNVNAFMDHFGIQHPLVHEQHNNIRQTSEDGQGLSDTAYEVVLPQLLARMKLYNSYSQSLKSAASELIHMNVRGSMVQTMMGDDFKNELASDSYSVSQMMAFHRHGKTDLIQRAQSLINEGERNEEGELKEIKFKLSTNVLPPGSGIYAKPYEHVAREQILKDSEMLEFILINEQIKTASRDEHVLNVAKANDALSIEYRKNLLTRYERIEFSRRDTQLEKLLDVVKDAFEGNNPKIPPSLNVTNEILEYAVVMVESFREICEKTGGNEDYSAVDRMIESLRIRAEKNNGLDIGDMDEEKIYSPDEVRQLNFLPSLDVERREPLKFAMKHQGIGYFFTHVKNKIDEEAEAENVISQLRKSRSP